MLPSSLCTVKCCRATPCPVRASASQRKRDRDSLNFTYRCDAVGRSILFNLLAEPQQVNKVELEFTFNG